MIKAPEKEDLLNFLYNLILEPTVKQEERDLFVKAKQLIETGDEPLPVLNQLLSSLRPLAIARRMSPAVSDFYVKAMTQPTTDQKFWAIIHAALLLSNR